MPTNPDIHTNQIQDMVGKLTNSGGSSTIFESVKQTASMFQDATKALGETLNQTRATAEAVGRLAKTVLPKETHGLVNTATRAADLENVNDASRLNTAKSVIGKAAALKSQASDFLSKEKGSSEAVSPQKNSLVNSVSGQMGDLSSKVFNGVERTLSKTSPVDREEFKIADSLDVGPKDGMENKMGQVPEVARTIGLGM